MTDCKDASRGSGMIEGVCSCLATLDTAQKQRLVDGFRLARPVRSATPNPIPTYLPTDMYTCIARFELHAANRAEIEILVSAQRSVPGMDSVELHVEPSGAACLELARTR